MRKPKWVRGTVRVMRNRTLAGPEGEPRDAIVWGNLAIILTDDRGEPVGAGWYTLTHAPSGQGFAVYFQTQRDAKAAAEKIAERLPEIVAWDGAGPYPGDTWTEKQRRDNKQFVISLGTA